MKDNVSKFDVVTPIVGLVAFLLVGGVIVLWQIIKGLGVLTDGFITVVQDARSKRQQ